MRLLSMIIAGSIILSCNSSHTILTKEEFARIYMDTLSRRHPDVKFTIDSTLAIVAKKGDLEFQYFIDNAYTAYKASPDSIKPILSSYAQSTDNLYTDPDKIDITKIVPVIKPIEYFENLNSLTNNDSGYKMLTEKYNDQLVIAYAEDHENNLQFLSMDDLDSISIPKDTLKALAWRNLHNIIKKLDIKGGNGLFMVTAGGFYEASLILSTTFWTLDNFKVKGNIVIAIPNRDLLLVTGTNEKEGIKKVKEMVAESFTNGTYPISEYLYKWNGKKFERFE